MKVLFLFGGLTHYYNPILNKLNSISGIEITLVVPDNTDSKGVGEAVHLSEEGIEFKVVKLKEYTAFYGKVFFKGLFNLVLKENPKIIVCGWPYILGFIFNLHLYILLKVKKIKLVNKQIPYDIPKYNESDKYFLQGKGMMTENMQLNAHTDNLFLRIKFKLLTITRKLYFNLVDAHVNYIEKAFEILESYKVKKEKIFIIYNSPDTDGILKIKEKIIKEAPILPENKHRILHVGRLVKWKKVDMLIRAFRKIKYHFSKTELVIIGFGPEENNLKQLAKQLNLQDSIIFTGGIYDMETLGKYYLSSSIYVLAGVGGLSINEAMCFNKPIICSECDGTEKKLVCENYNGIYFKADDENDLYDKIQYLLNNQYLIEVMGKNSLNIIQNEVNVHTVINGYKKAFNYVTNDEFNFR